MKTIEEMIVYYVSQGMTLDQARNYVAQEIILTKISKSKFANSILLKGGVVMFNETHEIRRTTDDLDFDFIRYDISDKSITKFIQLLDRVLPEYKVSLLSIEPLKQDDYKGKRVVVDIRDNSYSLRFKMDIGVHTLLAIEQTTSCFSFEDGKNQLFLKVNPPEQIVAEKLYSLAKHGAFSGRFKDVYDIYYFVSKETLNKNVIKQSIELLTMNNLHGLKSLEDICDIINTAFDDKMFVDNLKTTKEKWIDVDCDVMLKAILDYIYSL